VVELATEVTVYLVHMTVLDRKNKTVGHSIPHRIRAQLAKSSPFESGGANTPFLLQNLTGNHQGK